MLEKINYAAKEVWETYSKQLPVEYTQSVEEGLNIAPLKPLFDAIAALENGEDKAKLADIAYEMLQKAGMAEGYPYVEPNELDVIHAERPDTRASKTAYEKTALADRVTGAWYGRICGCLLGKAVEGIRTDELHPFLRQSGNLPLRRYILRADLPEDAAQRYRFGFLSRHCYADEIECAPTDDDTNYTAMAQELISCYGRDFTSEDVCRIWLSRQPKTAYCTAERVAYMNMLRGLTPPDTASFQNPYREWIGAQIRADYFGYINPGDPEAAAEMAWRDARISHVKNGIYGEMFAAAMIAAAAVTDDIPAIIRAGLGEIPARSRLYEAVEKLMEAWAAGQTQEEAFERIHERYDEKNGHDWCHTISNALIVVASLLYGGGDYGKSVCMAVQTGFDTDCNGATVGSILGMRGGLSAVDETWRKPTGGVLETSIIGVGKVTIDSLVKTTLSHIES